MKKESYNCNKTGRYGKDSRSRHRRPEAGRTTNSAVYQNGENTDNSNNKFSNSGSKAVYSVRIIIVYSMKNRWKSEGHREHDEVDIIVDIGASEPVVTNKKYLSDVKKIRALPINLADGTKVNATRKGNVYVGVVVRKSVPCRMYVILTVKVHIVSFSLVDKYGEASTFACGIRTSKNSYKRRR